MKIAILGAGIAGMSTAIALKLKGFNVSLYERSDAPSHLGAGIVLWPNATYVLSQLDLLTEFEAVAGSPARMQRLSSDGEDLGNLDISSIDQIMGYPSLSVLRRDVIKILHSRVESLGIKVNYNHDANTITTSTDGSAVVHCLSNQTIEADMIIGADGRTASCARQYIQGNNKPVYQRFINWIGICESKTDLFDDQTIADYWGQGERFGIVPINTKTAYWAGGDTAVRITPNNPRNYKQELVQLFSTWPAIVGDTISRTKANTIHKIYVHDHDPCERWHKNNVLMIGDAAHAPLPTTGQGACQALEDAWHVANCLEENYHNLDHAMTIFTNLRIEKTSQIIMSGRHLASSIFNRDRNENILRNKNSQQTDFSHLAQAIARGWSEHLPLSTAQ